MAPPLYDVTVFLSNKLNQAKPNSEPKNRFQNQEKS